MQEPLAVGLPLPEADAGQYITEGKAADKKQNQGKNHGFCFWRKGHKLIQCMPYDSMYHYKSTDAHANLICIKARCAADYLPDLGSVFNFSVVKGYIPAVICHAVYEGNIRVSCRQGNSLYRISITIPPGPVVFLGNGISSGNQTMDGGAAVSGDGHSDALTCGVVIFSEPRRQIPGLLLPRACPNGVDNGIRCHCAKAQCKELSPSSRGQAICHWHIAFR